MSCRILVVGGGSFIARHWLAITGHSATAISHDGIAALAGQRFDVIVNCAVSPATKSVAYREADDCDLLAARHAADTDSHFVMLSTRKVYRPSNVPIVLDEQSPVGPACFYGANKLESERRIAALLGERCTILRVANVYGREYGRQSFFGIATSRLRNEGRIVLDASPYVERDFLPVTAFAGLLDSICAHRPSGIHALGSGIGLSLGRIAQWLIQGHGRGVLEVIDVTERDAFTMNPAKLLRSLGLPRPHYDLESDIRNIGRLLNDE
jgi:UDP-glucose 4-epimerase